MSKFHFYHSAALSVANTLTCWLVLLRFSNYFLLEMPMLLCYQKFQEYRKRSKSLANKSELCFACITTTLHLLLHRITTNWYQSLVLSLFRVVHGFTSCGMLESQYQGFAEAAKLGNVGDKYIDNGEILI